jgi:hypothetical protein
MLDDAKYMVDQTRKVFKSSISIALVHCDELGDDVIGHFEGAHNITLFNICNGKGIFGMTHEETKHRLHSWFCKTAAVILSPFRETMVVDLDVVFFQKPDLLFDAPAYKKTGTLFFRDRLTFGHKKESINEKILQDVIEEYIVQHSAPLGVYTHLSNLTDIADSKVHEDGISFFWRNIANRDAPTLDNFQDSSVIVVDRSRHPLLIEVLTSLLPTFNLGYGDKEIYWVAAVISGQFLYMFSVS